MPAALRTLSVEMTRPPRRHPKPRRDRHGRGLRGRLVPAEVPLARSRAEQFDDLVRDVVVDQVAVLLGRDPEEIDPTG